jgi:hypothetical protein
MKRIAVASLCAALGCGGDDGAARGGGARVWQCNETRVRELVRVGLPPSAEAPEFVLPRVGTCTGGYAVIHTASADGKEGAVSRVDLSTFAVTESFAAASPDASVRHVDGRLYVLNRSGADTVRAFDTTDNFRAIGPEFTVADDGAAADPRDICCSSREECYVVRGADPEVLVVNPEMGGEVLGRIDLTTAEDPEPRPSACFLAGARLVVAQENHFTFVDLADPPSILSTLETAASNPAGRFVSVSATEAMIAEVGDEGESDGALELIDAALRASEGVKLTEEALGGDLIGVARCSAAEVWVIGREAGGHTSLRPVDLATDTEDAVVRRPLYEAEDGRLTGVAADACRRIWVTDRDLE